MPKKLTDLGPRKFEHSPLWWWKARDLGQLLGFGSRGGNLSRMYGMDVFGPTVVGGIRMWRRDSRGVIWLTREGVRHTLSALISRYPKYRKRALQVVDEMDPILPPLEEVEYVLGAGMAIRCTKGEITKFVFLDEYDRRHIIPIDDLDQGWHAVLTYHLKNTRG